MTRSGRRTKVFVFFGIAIALLVLGALFRVVRPDDARWSLLSVAVALGAAGCAGLLGVKSSPSRTARAVTIALASAVLFGAFGVLALLVGGWPFWVGVAGATQHPLSAERHLTEALRRADAPGSSTLPPFHLRVTANGIVPADRPLILVELALAQNHAGHKEADLRSLREALRLYKEQGRAHEASMVAGMLRRSE